ncbi:MAG: 16S rRNA (uracil(1498)-N(3))-methyltransferase [Geminicoccaceae bacterium]
MSAHRLHVAERLNAGLTLGVAGDRAHYLRNVLRLREGGDLRLFNSGDGEWAGRIVAVARHRIDVRLEQRLREPADEPGPTLVFAPIRRNRLDWLIEKAVELGVARLVPVLTARSVVRLDQVDRLRAIVVEAAEQCERLSVPAVTEPEPLEQWLARRPARPLLLADERGGGMPIAAAWRAHSEAELLIGPEGGFTDEEREALLQRVGAVSTTLGPLILRAETAALVGLAAWRLACGDHDP